MGYSDPLFQSGEKLDKARYFTDTTIEDLLMSDSSSPIVAARLVFLPEDIGSPDTGDQPIWEHLSTAWGLRLTGTREGDKVQVELAPGWSIADDPDYQRPGWNLLLDERGRPRATIIPALYEGGTSTLNPRKRYVVVHRIAPSTLPMRNMNWYEVVDYGQMPPIVLWKSEDWGDPPLQGRTSHTEPSFREKRQDLRQAAEGWLDKNHPSGGSLWHTGEAQACSGVCRL